MTDKNSLLRTFHFERTEILAHKLIAKETWQLTFRSSELAKCTRPGQFFMIRIALCNDPLIGRALAMFDRHTDSAGNPEAISVAYVVKGKFTQALSKMHAGQSIEVWGPLGNAFSIEPVDHLIMVAGGVGITPMLTLATEALGQAAFGSAENPKRYAARATLCYGARTREYLAGLEEFKSRGVELAIATEDGSLGHRGRVTEVLENLLRDAKGSVRIACCGPEPMMQAVSKLAGQHQVACEVSLETPMACGIGICFTCVAKIDQGDGSWDYRRTCIEGPIFDAQSIVW
jgi:dihydroorotate dehydrogenase electron transfer subunit